MFKDNAVSPVIGVLLMITLTLIITSIVYSYAGGLIETDPKPPTVTLQASCDSSNSVNEILLKNIGGDPIPVNTIYLYLRPSETFGTEAYLMKSMVNNSFITNISNKELSWSKGITVFSPGDIASISSDNLSIIQKNITEAYKINSANQGKTFFVEIYYKNSLIARNEVLIQ